MSTSYNGWPAGSREDAHIVIRTVPGTQVQLPVNKDAADLLIWCAEQFNLRVETLREGWCWGWADRLVRGSAIRVSNHASGTAIDLNAPKHPRGVPIERTFTKKQVSAINAILAEANAVDHVLDWGGNYRISPKDGMHFEIASATKAEVARAVERLDNADVVKPAKPPTLYKAGPPRPKWTRKLQRLLNANGFALDVDGQYGNATRTAVRQFRRRKGIRPAPPGVAGPKVWRALGYRW